MRWAHREVNGGPSRHPTIDGTGKRSTDLSSLPSTEEKKKTGYGNAETVREGARTIELARRAAVRCHLSARFDKAREILLAEESRGNRDRWTDGRTDPSMIFGLRGAANDSG